MTVDDAAAVLDDRRPLTPITAVSSPDPYPYYRALVAERPFYFDAVQGLWVATSAATVTAVLSNPACRVRPAAEPVPRGIVGTAAGDVFGSLVRMTDGSLQQRLKSVVGDALGRVDPAEVASIAAARTRGSLAAGSRSPLEDLMFRVPAQVIASSCGLDESLGNEAATLAADFVHCLSAAATPEQLAASARAAERLQDLLDVDAAPAGLLAELAAAAQRADWHETGPLIANAVGFLSQTYDAVAGLIGNTLVALNRGAVPSGTARSSTDLDAVVREVARHDSPVQNTRRFAAAPFSVGDAEVGAGQAILVVLAAANRDPAANPDPDEFVVDRGDPRLFTFGLGVHGCPGTELAVSIAAAVVARLLDERPDLAEVPLEPAYRQAPNVRIPML